MSFKQEFEHNFNQSMQDRGQSSGSSQADGIEMSSMMEKMKTSESPQLEAQDEQWSEKKQLPPRFSTIFGPAKPESTPPPAPLPVPIMEYYPPPREHRRGGRWVSWPVVFIILGTLMIETFLLVSIFTFVGLYSFTSIRVMPWDRPAAPSPVACIPAPAQKQAAINIAPNFIMGEAKEPVTVLVTVTQTQTQSTTPTPSPTSTSTTSTSSTTSSIDTTSQAAAIASDVLGILSSMSKTLTTSSTSTTTTSTTSSTTTSIDATSQAAAIASDVMGMLASLSKSVTTTPSMSFATVTYTPTQETVKSTLLLTVDASGNPVTTADRPTITLTSFADATNTAAAEIASRALATAEAAILPVASGSAGETAAQSSPVSASSSEIPAATSTSTEVATTTAAAPPASTTLAMVPTQETETKAAATTKKAKECTPPAMAGVGYICPS